MSDERADLIVPVIGGTDLPPPCTEAEFRASVDDCLSRLTASLRSQFAAMRARSPRETRPGYGPGPSDGGTTSD